VPNVKVELVYTGTTWKVFAQWQRQKLF
jgi:hypothetical protein